MKDRLAEQKRRTFEDTIRRQRELRGFVKKKMSSNTMLTPKERIEFYDLFPRAFLSNGKNVKVYFDNPKCKLFLGTVHSLASKMMDWEEPVVIKYRGVKATFKPKTLWMLLYDNMLEVFPKALDEAIHMSAEVEKREENEGFIFDPTKKL